MSTWSIWGIHGGQSKIRKQTQGTLYMTYSFDCVNVRETRNAELPCDFPLNEYPPKKQLSTEGLPQMAKSVQPVCFQSRSWKPKSIKSGNSQAICPHPLKMNKPASLRVLFGQPLETAVGGCWKKTTQKAACHDGDYWPISGVRQIICSDSDSRLVYPKSQLQVCPK